jgi:hypothetical protein
MHWIYSFFWESRVALVFRKINKPWLYSLQSVFYNTHSPVSICVACIDLRVFSLPHLLVGMGIMISLVPPHFLKHGTYVLLSLQWWDNCGICYIQTGILSSPMKLVAWSWLFISKCMNLCFRKDIHLRISFRTMLKLNVVTFNNVDFLKLEEYIAVALFAVWGLYYLYI